MKDNRWQLQDAKSRFSQLVDDAMQHEPQFVTRHGKNAVVILSFDEYKKITKPDTDLVTFLQGSPLADLDLEMPRNKDLPRQIDL